MDNMYIELNQKIDNIDNLKKYINSLDDNKLEQLFDDEQINPNIKIAIIEYCYERMNALPFKIFAKALFYLENAYLLTTHYKDKINSLTYLELTSLIYEIILDNSCLIELSKTNIFKKYLEEEKKKKKETKLQSFELIIELYLNENTEKLNSIGKKIEGLLQSALVDTEDIEILINYYLGEVIENNKEIPLDSNINKLGINIMNYYLKNHKQLSSKMIKFYILFHLKELSLDTYCKNVIISEEDSDVFGWYQQSTGTLRIFKNFLVHTYEPQKENRFREQELNDFFNLTTLSMISHEFGHIERHKEVEEFQKTFNDYENLIKQPSIYYWYKNGMLQTLVGRKKYLQSHKRFIEEVRADIFAIFDSSMEINKYFKDSFPKEMLQNFSRISASDIIQFYTEETNNKKTLKNPMQKFDIFFEEHLPSMEKYSPSKEMKTNTSPNEIINNLLLGAEVPTYVLEELIEIASGKRITDNIYKEILTIINNTQYQSTKEERKCAK